MHWFYYKPPISNNIVLGVLVNRKRIGLEVVLEV